MSSKAVHTCTGLAAGALLAVAVQGDALTTALLLTGASLGASAPDWMELAHARKRTSFLGFGRSTWERESIIPHRTITHTASLWLLAAIATGLYALHTHAGLLSLVMIGFVGSAITHLVFDVRTPMGIPLLPFGPRYTLHRSGWRLRPARTLERRRGWF